MITALLESARGWVNAGLGFVYPEVCQLCQEARATPAEGFICRVCRGQVHLVERPFCERCGLPFQGEITHPFECGNCREMDLHFRFARSAAVAKGGLLDAIHRYKYHRAFWFEAFFAELLVAQAKPELQPAAWDYLVPVPLHRTKQREREFNQAERLARCLSLTTGIPLSTHLLRRVRPTRTQTQLSREERLANVRKAFTFCGPHGLNGERIVLVDDVFTTGATTSACALVLREAGAGDVCVWTLARGI